MALTYKLIDDRTTNGTLTSFNINTGVVSFVPDPDFSGYAGYFTYSVNNGYFDSNIATVTVQVTEVNDAPNITTLPPKGTFNVGDSYSYSPIEATDPDHQQDELTWSLINAPSWITLSTTGAGFTGTATIQDDGTGVQAGNVTFKIQVTDAGSPGLYDEQEITIGGIVPTVDSYFKIIFDSSGSMATTQARLERDLLGDGVTDPYSDATCLKSYLQDFYATAGTEANGNTDTSTNGSDEYDAKVFIVNDGTERPFRQLNNQGIAFSTTFHNADTVTVMSFLDEASNSSIPYDAYSPSNSIPNATSMSNLSALKAVIDNSGVTYRGIYFAVEPNTTGDGRGVMQTFYDAFNNSTNSAFEQQNNNLVNYTSEVSLGNTVNAGAMFGYDLVDDGNTTNGYYTELVIDALINAGFSIDPYSG